MDEKGLTEHMKQQLKYRYEYHDHELELEIEQHKLDLKKFIIKCQHELQVPYDWVLDLDRMVFIPPPKKPKDEKCKE